MWKKLRSWERGLVTYAEECYDLGRLVGDTAAGRLALAPLPQERVADAQVEEGFYQGFISWICRFGIEARSPDADAFSQDKLKIVDRWLRYGGTELATSPSRDKLVSARDLFVELVGTVPADPSTGIIATQKKGLDRDAMRLRRVAGDILLLGVVTGRCSVCKQLGI